MPSAALPVGLSHPAAMTPGPDVTTVHGMLAYLRGLSPQMTILWCYLIWYLVVLVRWFDPSPWLWLNSCGISLIIGTALYLSTTHAGRVRTMLNRWQILRLYLMPLCVSSFAALIKDRGFILILHPNLRDNLLAAGAIVMFCLVVVAAKRFPMRATTVTAPAA